jgi:HTH-type transcriptional regulator/antitoxin HipB
MRLNVTSPGQVGEVVRARRRAHKLSQAELAAQLGISQSRLSIIEQNPGSLTLERLISLCSVLGLSLVLQEKPARESKSSNPAW